MRMQLAWWLPANARDSGSIPGSGGSPGGGNGNPLQYSCLGNPMDRRAWRGLWCEPVSLQEVRHDWASTHAHHSWLFIHLTDFPRLSSWQVPAGASLWMTAASSFDGSSQGGVTGGRASAKAARRNSSQWQFYWVDSSILLSWHSALLTWWRVWEKMRKGRFAFQIAMSSFTGTDFILNNYSTDIY